jgi:hypothetical protein
MKTHHPSIVFNRRGAKMLPEPARWQRALRSAGTLPAGSGGIRAASFCGAGRLRSALAVLLGSLLALGGAGCSSTPASASFASVTIHGHSAEEIGGVTVQVFREAGYSGGAGGRQMVFQKEGSRGDSIAYNGIANTHYGAQAAIRVKTELVSLGEDSYRLQCQAYMVRDAGDSFMEEEQRLTNMRSGPYQKLLNQVEKQLKK